MRFTKALKLKTVVLEKVEETEEMIEDKKLKRIIGGLEEDEEEETIIVKEAFQEVSYYSIDYLAKDDNFPNRCIICSSGHEDVVEMSVEDLEVKIEAYFKDYGIK